MSSLKKLTAWVNGLNGSLDNFNRDLREHNFNIKKKQYLKDNPNNPNPTVEEVELYWIKFENMFDEKHIDKVLKKHKF